MDSGGEGICYSAIICSIALHSHSTIFIFLFFPVFLASALKKALEHTPTYCYIASRARADYQNPSGKTLHIKRENLSVPVRVLKFKRIRYYQLRVVDERVHPHLQPTASLTRTDP